VSKLTKEELIAIKAEEAAIAAKHARAERSAANQNENGKLYEKAPKSKSGFAFINRQCKAGDDPIKHTLHKPYEDITYMQVQYFENTKRGSAKHVLKIEWSTDQDPEKAKDRRYQSKAYFNLYARYQIKYKARERLGEIAGDAIYEKAKNTEPQCGYEHHLQECIFGFCTVQIEKGGTKIFEDHQVFATPRTDADEKNFIDLTFTIDKRTFKISLHQIEHAGAGRKPNSAMYVGYKQAVTNEELKEAIREKTNDD